MKSLKIYEKNKIVINNYENIHDFNEKEIIVDNYHICGQNLLITKIDEISVEIKGEITKIEVL